MWKGKFPGQSQKVTVARNKAHIERFGFLKSSPDTITVITWGMRCLDSWRGRWQTEKHKILYFSRETCKEDNTQNP